MWAFSRFFVSWFLLQAAAPAASEAKRQLPAEETRLDTAKFREGLKRRGLTGILEQHVRDYPPAGSAESLLLLREVKLAEFADPKRTPDERRAAMAEANRILETLLQQESADLRRFEWRFVLAHSLLYDEGDPWITGILFRGGSPRDRAELRTLTTRSLAEVSLLREQLAEQYARIDEMSVAEFEKLERGGFIETIDRLAPRADYLMPWAQFFDALARDDADAIRADHLNRIALQLREQPTLLTTPHGTSRVQVQALLLAGMTFRRLNDYPAAREHLDRALAAAERVDDRAEQKRIEWAVRVAWIERIRNEADDGKFEEAFTGVKRFQGVLSHGGDVPRALTVTVAMLERSIHLARASAAERAGRSGDAKRHRDEAWQPLLVLARRSTAFRDAVYAAVYDAVGPDADPAALDPFEQCALIAGLLADAGRAGRPVDRLLNRAVELALRIVDAMPDSAKILAPELVPEVLYHAAVAEYRRARLEEAAQTFLRVAQDYPAFSHARQAAVYATDLAAEIYAEPASRSRPEVQGLYRTALRTLVTDYGDTDKARYYRFYYAQLLDELGEYDLAAVQYAFVGSDHELYLESTYLRIRSMALGLQRHARQRTDDPLGLRHRFNDFLTAQRDFVAQAGSALRRAGGDDREAKVRNLLASSRLLLAEVQVLPAIDRPTHALETLGDWESEFPNERPLAGRVWRVRLLAYEALGRREECLQAIPSYVAADPTAAASTLQSLFGTLSAEVETLRSAGDPQRAQVKAEVALALARQLFEIAHRADGTLAPVDRHEITIQLGMALLQAGEYVEARDLFRGLLPEDGSHEPHESADPRVAFGFSESMFGLHEYEKSLVLFNRLATKLPPADVLRWKALLRDLQCRTALGQPADGIVKVIQQQKYLNPDLGGPSLAPQFQQLLRENERRAKGE